MHALLLPLRLLAVLALWPVLLDAAPRSKSPEIEALYRRALAGEKEAVPQVIARLEQALRQDPANQLARVYLGSSYTLLSRDLGYGPRKLQTLRRGLAIMDEAVAAAPNDPQIRLARALTTDALPRIFGRAKSTRADFEMLGAMAEKKPAGFASDELQIIWYRAGLVAKDAGDTRRAAALFQKASAHPVDPTLAEKIRAELKVLDAKAAARKGS